MFGGFVFAEYVGQQHGAGGKVGKVAVGIGCEVEGGGDGGGIFQTACRCAAEDNQFGRFGGEFGGIGLRAVVVYGGLYAQAFEDVERGRIVNGDAAWIFCDCDGLLFPNDVFGSSRKRGEKDGGKEAGEEFSGRHGGRFLLFLSAG